MFCGVFILRYTINDIYTKLLKEANERGPTKTELKLQEKIHALEKKLKEKERKWCIHWHIRFLIDSVSSQSKVKRSYWFS
jgi:hypothetical protein